MTLLTYLRNDLLLENHEVSDFARGILPDHISHEYDYDQLERFFRQLRRFNFRNHGGFIYDLMSNADLD